MQPVANPIAVKFLAVPEILARRCGGRTKLYADIARGRWPALVKFGTKSVQPEAEVNLMLAAITAGKAEGEILELVEQIHATRTSSYESLTPKAG